MTQDEKTAAMKENQRKLDKTIELMEVRTLEQRVLHQILSRASSLIQDSMTLMDNGGRESCVILLRVLLENCCVLLYAARKGELREFHAYSIDKDLKDCDRLKGHIGAIRRTDPRTEEELAKGLEGVRDQQKKLREEMDKEHPGWQKTIKELRRKWGTIYDKEQTAVGNIALQIMDEQDAPEGDLFRRYTPIQRMGANAYVHPRFDLLQPEITTEKITLEIGMAHNMLNETCNVAYEQGIIQ